jgi:predicted nucleic acid-binding protein
MPTVSDSSPLIFFSAIGRLDLLHEIFGEILVPPAVWREIVIRGAGRPGANDIQGVDWIRQEPPNSQMLSVVRRAGIDEGETEAIALALSMHPVATVILDDFPARRVALNAGLEVTGTGGIAVLAKQFGLVASVGSVLTELRAAGLYLSESTVRRFVELAGER